MQSGNSLKVWRKTRGTYGICTREFCIGSTPEGPKFQWLSAGIFMLVPVVGLQNGGVSVGVMGPRSPLFYSPTSERENCEGRRGSNK